ncbi:Lysosomal Pro-X carboxypeptidase, partial [Bienertia sinuspersici]
PLQSVEELKQPLAQLYSSTAQFDLPGNPEIKSLCLEVLRKHNFTIEALVEVLYKLVVGKCFDANISTTINMYSPFEPLSNETLAWAWQRCNELIYPIGCVRQSMLPSQPFHMAEFKRSCQERFGITPHPHLLASFFENHTMLDYLVQFGGNIIFSNGLKDPFCSGAILKSLSTTITAITTKGEQHNLGSYCWDMHEVKNDDPKWLKENREKELKIFGQWINEFHHTSKAYKPLAYSVMICVVVELIIITCTIWM